MTEPRYRFWGRTNPLGRRKPPLVAQAPTATDDDDGVAVMRLYDPIDSWGDVWGTSAKEFAAALDDVGSGAPLRLHINSPGGEVFEGLAILNTLRARRGQTTVVVDGLAASAASIVAMGGDSLVMMPNSELMIHDAWGLCIGNAADMHDMAGTLDQVSNNLASVYAGKAGGTTGDWRAVMQAETWYSAEEAVEAKLADSVWADPAAADDTATADVFDLGQFRYAGRASAPAPSAAKRETVITLDLSAMSNDQLANAMRASLGLEPRIDPRARALRLRNKQQAARLGLPA